MRMKDLIDVERHDPSGKSDYLSVQHVERYNFALDYIQENDVVLDIACGVGYGTYLMSQTGAKVIGNDYDKDTIELAKRAYPNLDFGVANALDLPYEDNSFDVVITFETIEHVDDGDKFLREMHRVLKPGGVFICSTPNVSFTSHPPYHIKEYEINEFFFLVKKYFDEVDEYSQCFTFKDMVIDKIKYTVPRFIKNYIKKIIHLKSPGYLGTTKVGGKNNSLKGVYKVSSTPCAYTRIMVVVCKR